MEFLDVVLGLFPMVATTAILIRYLVEFGKRHFSFVSAYPGRAQAVLNAVAWVGLGIAAHYGAEGEVLDVLRQLTDSMPGLLGLIELLIPVFMGVLATKGAHEVLKHTESRPLGRMAG